MSIVFLEGILELIVHFSPHILANLAVRATIGDP